MRTRRSVRNQNILYRELFPEPEKPMPIVSLEPYTADSPHLFGLSPKRKAQAIRQRAQEIARARIKAAMR